MFRVMLVLPKVAFVACFGQCQSPQVLSQYIHDKQCTESCVESFVMTAC